MTMAVHKKYYEDGTIQSLLETRRNQYDDIRVEINYKAEYTSDGLIETSCEENNYYVSLDGQDRLAKKSILKRDQEKDSQSIILYYKTGLIQSRTFLTCTPFSFTEEVTRYGEAGELLERKTLQEKTNPCNLRRTEDDRLLLVPIGERESSILRRNLYENGHIKIHYGKDISGDRIREIYSDYDEEGNVAFIEKKEVRRDKVMEGQIVETINLENTLGLKEQHTIFEEIKGNVTERLHLYNEGIEEEEKGNYYTYLTFREKGKMKYLSKESWNWIDDAKFVEKKETIYRPDGEVLLLRKKVKKTYFDEAGALDMVLEKEVEEEGKHVKQVLKNKMYGMYVGDYIEEITTLHFEEDKLLSCQIEHYFDRTHLLGIMEMTKEVPESAYSLKQLHTVKKIISFGGSEEVHETPITVWHRYLEHRFKRERVEAIMIKEFPEDILRSARAFMEIEQADWAVEQDVEQTEADIEFPDMPIEPPMEASPL